METQKSLVKGSMNLPAFVQDAYETIEKMEQFSQLLLDSKLVPDHLYEKGVDKKPDYNKGKVPAVMMILLQGHQLNLPPLTALQHIIPVNGLLSIKGDAAKTLIFNSGKLQPGSWKEITSGDIEAGTYKVSITAQRSDTKEILTRSFSVNDAKRAGLWITPSMLTGQDGWKWKKSAWYKFPTRMCAYRALGFLARDLFPDVLSGIYTTEEAIDLPQETETIIETPEGNKIIIPDQDFNKERSQNLTSKAAEKIDKVNKVPEQSKITLEDSNDDLEQHTNQEEKTPVTENNEEIKVYSEEELKKMEQSELLKIVQDNPEMNEANNTLDPPSNTQPKLRKIITLYQEGKLKEVVEGFIKQKEEIRAKKEAEKKKDTENDDIPMEPVGSGDGGDQSELPEEQIEIPEITGTSDIEPNIDFEVEKKSVDQSSSEQLTSNIKGIVVPELLEEHDPPRRDLKEVNRLWHELDKELGVNSRMFDVIVESKLPELKKYAHKEDFLKYASVHEVHLFINNAE